MLRCALLALMLAWTAVLAAPARAYTPLVFNSAVDTGVDFSTIAQNASASVIGAALKAGNMGNQWGQSQWYADGKSLWLSSASSQKWPSTGFMSNPVGCPAGFGYGHFHWRAQSGYNSSQANQGPGANLIMWTADNDPNWPGVGAKISVVQPAGGKSGPAPSYTTSNNIGEVDIFEGNYASNNTGFATFHSWDGSTRWVADSTQTNGGNWYKKDVQAMFVPMVYPSGQSPNTMNDYDVYWSAGSLIEYVDGIFQHSASSNQVSADYAHGGCNYTLGAQLAMQATAYDKLPTVQLLLANMWWDSSTSPGAAVTTPNQISISPPSNLVAGTGFNLSGGINFTVPTSLFLIVNSGSPIKLSPSSASGIYTLAVPPSAAPAGPDTFQVETTDGSIVSPVITATVAAAGGATAPAGSVPTITPFYAQIQDIPVTLNAGVTTALVDWRTTGQPAVGDADNVPVSGIGTANPVAHNVTIDHPGTASTLWLSINGGAFVAQWMASPTAATSNPTATLALDAVGPFLVGQSCSLTGENNFAMSNTQVSVNGTLYPEQESATGQAAGSTVTIPCPPAVTAAAGSTSVQVTSGGVTSNTISISVVQPVLAGILPAPFYTGLQRITGTGGISGLQLEAVSGSAGSTALGTTGWINATVNNDGTWSAVLSQPTPGGTEHVYAAQGGSTTVVDLVDGTPTTPPIVANAIILAAPAPVPFGSSGTILGSANYPLINPVVWIDGQATGLSVVTGSGTVTLPVPPSLPPGPHSEQLIDGTSATSNAVNFLVDYNSSLLSAAIDAELATSDGGIAKRNKIDAMLGVYIGLGH